MKLMQLLAILSLATLFSPVHGESSNEDDVQAYCIEQAALAGIEDDNVEKEEFVAECVNSYATSQEGEQATE